MQQDPTPYMCIYTQTKTNFILHYMYNCIQHKSYYVYIYICIYIYIHDRGANFSDTSFLFVIGNVQNCYFALVILHIFEHCDLSWQLDV